MASFTKIVQVSCPLCDHAENAEVGIAITAVDGGLTSVALMMDAEVLDGPGLVERFDTHYLEAHRGRR